MIIERSSGEIGDCNYCFTTNTKIISPRDEAYRKIKEYLNGLVNIYQVETKEMAGEGNLLRIELVEFWHIFNVDFLDNKSIHKMLINILSERYEWQPKLFNSSVVIGALQNEKFKAANSIFGEKSYAEFVEILKTKQRFHIDGFNKKIFGRIVEYATLSITTSDLLYRARLCEEGKVRKINEMGAPESEYASPGRANPKGISHLYLASSQDIAIKEIRAGLHDEVSVAQFRLKEDILVVDIEQLDRFSPFLGIDYEEYGINKEHLQQIKKAMLMPVKSESAYLEYLPTQYLIDFIKSIGISGVKFSSTMDERGYNLVLFDQDLVVGNEKVEYIGIKKIEYSY